ncbi:hypothetical protein ACQUZK_10010, partial [Streptococcus pyogenes]|uniref:hypothetical protein n=1 Tax=Streptococcus pyogenes TaxID=1314 RepID=UPI003DA1C479
LASGDPSGVAAATWSADAWGCAPAPAPVTADAAAASALLVEHPAAAATGSSVEVMATVSAEFLYPGGVVELPLPSRSDPEPPA